jgi:hypothetical protein
VFEGGLLREFALPPPLIDNLMLLIDRHLLGPRACHAHCTYIILILSAFT